VRLTEEQAKTKQCRASPAAMIPQVQTGRIAAAGHMDHVVYGFSTCIASACCHWRFMPGVLAAGTEQAVGYCGLAGKPE
jgi:hypothetical protein